MRFCAVLDEPTLRVDPLCRAAPGRTGAAASRCGLALPCGEGPRYAGTMCWRALAPSDALPPDYHDRHVNQWSGAGGFVISYYIRQGKFINFVAVLWQRKPSGPEDLAQTPTPEAPAPGAQAKKEPTPLKSKD